MKLKFFILFLFFIIARNSFPQSYPAFGPEKNVAITGLAFDAMEPFISPDGNTLFFNSLNSGGNTNIYYATKVNDSTFTFAGLVGGCYDPSPNHLDAVASLDSMNNFFWISVRNYPAIFENLHRGIYAAGNVSNISRVYGNFYIYSPGWIIMDGTINYPGNLLYYNNAYFNNCMFNMPCEARIGIAGKINDSTFIKLGNTDALLANVNDTNYIVYAPQITHDGLELYFTRILKTTVNSEICVSVRTNPADVFSLPSVIYSNLGYVPEAATLTADKQKFYYHQKDNFGIHRIFLRYRIPPSGISEHEKITKIKLHPNPAGSTVTVSPLFPDEKFEIEIYSILGTSMIKSTDKTITDISHFPNGLYFVSLKQNGKLFSAKLIKQ